jgi:hypothetical protein
MNTDTLGNEINIGDLICFSGKGNKDAEYGMITGVITNIQKDKIKYNRLDVKYPDHKNPVISIVNRSKEYGKFVKVTSYPSFIHSWLNGKFQDAEEKRIAKWIHKGIIE